MHNAKTPAFPSHVGKRHLPYQAINMNGEIIYQKGLSAKGTLLKGDFLKLLEKMHNEIALLESDTCIKFNMKIQEDRF